MGQRRRICLAGATGRVGKATACAILAAPDLELVGAVSRKNAGQSVGDAVADCHSRLPITGTVEEALGQGTDVLIDFTTSEAAPDHARIALRRGVHVVMGPTRIPENEWREIDALARQHNLSVAFASNYAITMAFLQHLACQAARQFSEWEVIDRAGPGIRAPLGTTVELRQRMMEAGGKAGPPAIHSVRLPGVVSQVEAVFGEVEEQLVLTHTCSSPAAYARGALSAARRAGAWSGLMCGLDRILGF
jgi:4-hydroxy-tetrahydrodipicolinate reductase